MKKITVILFSILLIVSSVCVTCFAANKGVATGSSSGTTGKAVIGDASELTTTIKPTTESTTDKLIVTTNMFQYAESLKTTTTTTTKKTTESTSFKPQSVYMNATFVVDAPEAVTGDIQVSIYNKNTNENFYFVLPENNNYFLIVEIPVGSYTFSEITIKDNEGRFVAESYPFYIGKTMNSIVNISVFDTKSTPTSPNTNNSLTSQHTTNENVTELTTNVDIIVQPKKKNINFIIPVVFVVFIAGIYIHKKINKKNIENDKESQNDVQTPTNRF